MTIADISIFDIFITGGLLLLLGMLSLILQLQITKPLFVALTRSIIQLTLVGYLLRWLFNIHSMVLLFLVIIGMTFIGAQASVGRLGRRYKGIFWDSLLSIALSCWLTISFAILIILGDDSWNDARYLIPFAGILIGNSLTGISLGLGHFNSSLPVHQKKIEMLLAYGASSWEASKKLIIQSFSQATTPILNSMTVAGIVSLPGVMTGQLLVGVDPALAARYQIVILFLIAAATSIGSLLSIYLSFRRHFHGRFHRMQLETLT